MDWLEQKRAKALRVSNERESFQLRKIRRSLDSMKNINDNLLRQEERKVRKWLKKQSQFATADSYKALYYKTSSYPESIQDQNTQPASGKDSVDMPWSQFSVHLPDFVSFLRLPTKRASDDRKNSKDMTPFSGMALPPQNFSARHGNAMRHSLYNTLPPNKDSRKGSNSKPASLDNSMSLQEAVALFPSLQRMSVKGDRLMRSSTPHNPVSGLPALQKKLRGMLEREWEEEKYRPIECLPQIKPEEFLSCRYLRLSQSNIDTLLELCKESGIYIDLHPHMKESEIDFTTVLSSHPSKSY